MKPSPGGPVTAPHRGATQGGDVPTAALLAVALLGLVTAMPGGATHTTGQLPDASRPFASKYEACE